MEKCKDNRASSKGTALLAMLLAVAFAIIQAVAFFCVNGANRTIPVIVAVGLLLMVGCLFFNEEHLYKAAYPVYVAVLVLLILQLTLETTMLSVIYKRFLFIGDVAIKSSCFLILLAIPGAKAITRYEKCTAERGLVIAFAVAVCLAAVFVQPNTAPALLGLAVMLVIFAKATAEKKISPIVVVVVAAVLFVGLAVMFLSGVYSSRIETILARGKNEPYGIGWTRIVLDGIFMQTPFVGATNYVAESIISAEEYAYEMGGVFTWILAKFGWLAFAAVTVVYVLVILLLLKMVRKTNQSSFAKYVSFALFLSITARFAFYLLGVFVLNAVYIYPPFMSQEKTALCMDFISLGIICGLYARRNIPSSIKPLGENFMVKFRKKSLRERISKYITIEEVEDDE